MNEKEIASARFLIPTATGQPLRLAAHLAKTTLCFHSEIIIRWCDHLLDAKNLINLLKLCAQYGAVITVIARGSDACEALDAIGTVFSSMS